MRYVLSNLGQGLRRNTSMHLAVVLTLFVSLSLVGFGALLNRQTDHINDQLGSELEITAYLCRKNDNNPDCLGEVTEAQKKAIVKVVEDSPEVAGYRFESQETAFEKTKELYGPEEADRFEGPNAILRPEDLPASIWITLKDPREFEGITSAVVGLDGVARLVDQRETVGQITGIVDWLQRAALIVAGVLGLAALLLVANTIRLAAFARHRGGRRGAGRRCAGGVRAVRRHRALLRVHRLPSGRLGRPGVRRGRGRHRRTGHHAGADTPADPQIRQSLTRAP